MTSSRNISDYGRYPLPTDTTKKYNIQPGTGWVEASAGGSAPQLFHLQDQKSQGTAGGQPNPGFVARTLNTVMVNQISGSTTSSSSIFLPAGTYFLDASAPHYGAERSKTRLYNNTDGVSLLAGTSEMNTSGGTIQTRSFCTGYFTVSAGKELVFQSRVTAGFTINSHGYPGNTGEIEVYADLKIWKIS